MNIPENILQAVADAAFDSTEFGSIIAKASHIDFPHQDSVRRAVIQHAISNPALAPFLAGGIGEYTDEEIQEAWRNTNLNRPDLNPFSSKWVHVFLSTLPRRESPALADAVARAEKAEAECLSWKGNAEQAWQDHAKVSKELGEAQSELAKATARAKKAEEELNDCKDHALSLQKQLIPHMNAEIRLKTELAATKAELAEAQQTLESWSNHIHPETHDSIVSAKEKEIAKLKDELAALKSAQFGVLRPISEMPEEVPEGCVLMTGWKNEDGIWSIGPIKESFDTHFAILRLPATEPRQERPVGFNSALETWGADGSEPAAQVPLGPEDMKPDTWLDIHGDGEIVKVKSWGKLGVINDCRDERRRIFSYDELFKMGSKINTSIPDTGRWDKDAWRPCSKPGK